MARRKVDPVEQGLEDMYDEYSMDLEEIDMVAHVMDPNDDKKLFDRLARESGISVQEVNRGCLKGSR